MKFEVYWEDDYQFISVGDRQVTKYDLCQIYNYETHNTCNRIMAAETSSGWIFEVFCSGGVHDTLGETDVQDLIYSPGYDRLMADKGE